ncbi:glycine-rich domain-containing protein [Duganella guangzhouensis]|uniref:glycine-rich domain-containing protein n=1 Tax=Duganella guangzhouensis TaxID=2666084 RepID=UPI0018A1E8CF|nr:hypothetical protein [Duganella guangzhouensis]
MNLIAPVVCVAFAGVSVVLWWRLSRSRREAYIRDFILPQGLFDKLRARHPHLSVKDCHLVAQGLRQFFLAHLKSGRRFVSMPSQVVDDLWHEFILYTKNYQQFCGRAFGRFLHHTPAAVLKKGQQGNGGIQRAWYYACQEENINPRHPSRLPLLFALDSKLNIVNGFVYVPNCASVQRQGDSSGATPYCGADLGAAGAGCGGDSDFSDGGGHGHGHGHGGDGGDGGGHGGGDGGGDGGGGDGGCGGGGCGGGGD